MYTFLFLIMMVNFCLETGAAPSFSYTNSFDEALTAVGIYSPEKVKDLDDWDHIKKLYYTFVETEFNSSQTRIPKIVHQIWLGSPFPQKYREYQKTWQEKHPDWQYMLWTEKEIDALGLINRSKYDAAANYGEKSDIARYEILYRIGGLYIDTDFECLYPFDCLLGLDFFAGIAWGHSSNSFEVYNGLIGSVPGHPILRECIQSMGHSNGDIYQIMNSSGPVHFTRCIKQWYKNPDAGRVVLFPCAYFYPYPNSFWVNPLPRQQALAWARPYSLAIHYWHRSWFQ